MAGTHVWRSSRMLASTSTSTSHRRRVPTRLWTLLHAPGLLQGPAAGADTAACVEDDHCRLAGPRGY